MNPHEANRAWKAIASAVAFCALTASPAPASAPQVKHLIAFRDGSVSQKAVRAQAASVRVEGRRCGVARGTALSALLRSRPGRIGLADFGSCTRRGRDGGGLFVNAIRGERNRGSDGWTYKVQTKAATAGSADPSGAFGNGRLRSGQRVTWFFCRLRGGSCQRTLRLSFVRRADGVVASVKGYDDQGRAVPVAGAEVAGGGLRLTTDASGRTPVFTASGQALRARKRGLVASFSERAPVP